MVENEFSEVSSIHQLLKLPPERWAVHSAVCHSIVEGALFLGSWSFWVGRQWPWMSDEVLAFDYIIRLIHRDSKEGRICFVPMTFIEMPNRLDDNLDRSIWSVLEGLLFL